MTRRARFVLPSATRRPERIPPGIVRRSSIRLPESTYWAARAAGQLAAGDRALDPRVYACQSLSEAAAQSGYAGLCTKRGLVVRWVGRVRWPDHAAAGT